MTARNALELQGDPLQLLTTFRALVDQGALGRAAGARGMTQSAASKHLAKLRTWFGDELFIRTSRGMQPTAKALSLVEQVESILRGVDALSAEAAWEPAGLRGEMAIAATDEVRHRLVLPLMRAIQVEAPELRTTWLPLAPDYSLPKLETGEVAIVIGVSWHAPPQLLQKKLFDDHFVCVMRDDHALARKRLTLRAYCQAPHIMVAPLGRTEGIVDEALARVGLRRFVRLSIPDFSQLSGALLGSEHILTVPSRVADELGRSAPLVRRQPPVDLPHVRYFMFWHRRYGADSARGWLRQLIVKCLGA